MSEIALYYPHVHPRDEAWIKQAALSWPVIQRIVPDDYPITDSPTLARLVEAGVLTNRAPDAGAARVAGSFVDFVASHADALRSAYSANRAMSLPSRPGWHDDQLDPRLGWIHSGKLERSAAEALVGTGLASAHQAGEPWLGMHPALADVYMCALAGELSSLGKTTPITDGALHHAGSFGWAFEDLARALLPEVPLAPAGEDRPAGAAEEIFLAVALSSVLPRNLEEIPVERVLELRKRHGDEFSGFRRGVAALRSQLSELDGVQDRETLEQHVALLFEQTLDRELTDLRKILESHKLDTAETALAFGVVAPSGFLLEAAADLAAPGVGIGAATAIAAVKSARGVRGRHKAAMSKSPAAWLVRVDEGLRPDGLVKQVASSIKRFVR